MIFGKKHITTIEIWQDLNSQFQTDHKNLYIFYILLMKIVT